MVDAIFGVTLTFMVLVWVATPFTLSSSDRRVTIGFACAGLLLLAFNVFWAMHFGKY
ncbi:hypothetical protein PHABIO_350 [Pseudomonas phage Phabio]|uniref:Uncharacterized protein n=1 Tax=Pseudomonas phage Phabio TaxID=2006668 RepID=A0A1Y0STZ9_9CAUD|nr:hypothetical protein MZD05_gp350 [Pseudomonas phage Phabio]ARV76981.1 hypothetical protein PHABIO_350 [Pseudomonas phage Phabio]